MVGSSPNIVVLLGRQGERGVWKFLYYHNEYVGVPLKTTRDESDLLKQIQEALLPALGSDSLVGEISVRARMDPLLIWPDGSKSLLVLANYSGDESLDGEWVVLPEVLRRMPKNHNRVAFMKVFQNLSSSPEDECDALELTRELVDSLFPPTS